MIELASESSCTGCAACVDICPTNSISYTAKERLHYFPRINNISCVQCGKCVAVCPALNTLSTPDDFTQQYYYAWNKNIDDRLSSTSGGIGSALAKNAIKVGYWVCGVSFSDSWAVKHILTNKEEELDQLRGSKYLQSNTLNIFSQIKDLLDNGNKVFFIGTPCQIEALKRFVNKQKHSEIITCGIICHGVNSPKVWGDYIENLEQKYRSEIIAYNFRCKSHGWQKENGGPNLRVSYRFENGKKVDVPSWRNQFHTWFGHHYILRPSCLNCKYRTVRRNSDITIGDFWGIDKIHSDIDTHDGVSALIISSKVGSDFLKTCDNIKYGEVDANKAISVLRGFTERTKPERREQEMNTNIEFEKQYVQSSYYNMVKQYPVQSYLNRTIDFIRHKLHLK